MTLQFCNVTVTSHPNCGQAQPNCRIWPPHPNGGSSEILSLAARRPYSLTGKIYTCQRILALPAVEFAECSQIHSAKIIEARKPCVQLDLPSTLPYECAIKQCACNCVLWLLYQLPFLDSPSQQTSHPIEVDGIMLLLFFAFTWYCGDKFLFSKMLS